MGGARSEDMGKDFSRPAAASQGGVSNGVDLCRQKTWSEADRMVESQREQQDIGDEVHPEADTLGNPPAGALRIPVVGERFPMWAGQSASGDSGRLDAPPWPS